MKADSYRFDGSGKCRLDKLATDSKTDGVDKEKILAKTTAKPAKNGRFAGRLLCRRPRRTDLRFAGHGRRRQGQHHQTM